MWQKIKCLLGLHSWVYVGRRTIFDILENKPTLQYVCKHCGKEKR